MKNLWNDESGVLTFEWILLITLLVIGIVGGIAVVRDAYIVEAAETASAMMATNQGYTINAAQSAKISGITSYVASTTAKTTYTDNADTATPSKK